MSKQLSVASAFSVLALSALTLFAPGSARLPGSQVETGATIGIAAPALPAALTRLD